MNLHATRSALADKAFAAYDFGPEITVESSNGWAATSPGRDLSRKVFCAGDPDSDDGEGATFVVNFTVLFESADSSRITEVYALSADKGSPVGTSAPLDSLNEPPPVSSWDQSRAQTILAEAKVRYGAGWDHLSDDQRNNFLDAQVLRCLMAQDVEKFTAAQEMVDRMRQAIAATSQVSARDKRRSPAA